MERRFSMKEFILLAVGLINLVMNIYTLYAVKGVEFKVGFLMNLASGKYKKVEKDEK